MDSHNTNDAVDYGLANERWLTIYKYYLMAAVALSVFGFAKFIVLNSGRVSGGQLVGALVYGIAQIGLFVFALRSLKRVGEKWVRTLQLSINGVAVIMLINGLTQILPYNIFMRVGDIAVFPISALIPWQLVYGQPLLYSLFRMATSIASLTFAAYFFFRWLKSVRPTPVMTADSQNTPPPAAERQSKAASSGGERLAGLITFIVGIIMLLPGLSGGLLSPGGSLLLIFLGIGLMLVGLVFMIFGRWGFLFQWW